MNNFQIKLIDDVNKDQLYKLWNDEYEFIYPISKELWNRNISNLNNKLSFIAYDDDKIIGFLIGKTWQDEFIIEKYLDCAWISIMYVIPHYRKCGVGSSLLTKFEEEVKSMNIKTIYLGRDYNNFFPGLPVDLGNFVNWFKEKGFSFPGQTHDLIRFTKDLDKLRVENQGEYEFRLGTPLDKEAILSFIGRVWPGRWQKEAIDYFELGGTGKEYLICLNKNKEICGFVKVCGPQTLTPCISYSLTWRNRFKALGGIGPLGIDPNYRRKHLGYDIVSSAVNVLIDQGAKEIIIDWTSLLEFYRHMGFQVWKSYFYANKLLN